MKRSLALHDQEADLLAALGRHVRQWRLVSGISQDVLAERAQISLPTLRKVEQGDPGVRLGAVVGVLVALQLDERVAEATDPLGTDVGRLRAHLLGRARAPKAPR